MKGEIRIMKEELSAIERYRVPKEKSLQQSKSSLEAMSATREGLESELHQDLMEQLSVSDQHQVCFCILSCELISIYVCALIFVYFRSIN